MFKQISYTFVLGCLVVILASCAKNESKDDAQPGKETPIAKEAPPPTKPDPREVTLHIDGMSEQLKLV